MITTFLVFNENIRWYKDGAWIKDDEKIENLKHTLMTVDVYKGDRVICIRDVINVCDNPRMSFPIKKGDIKIIEAMNFKDRRVYFKDTPIGCGNYDGSCFVLAV